MPADNSPAPNSLPRTKQAPLPSPLSIFGAIRRGPSQPDQKDGARVGDRIGEFRLDARIASGGQGEVWEATQLSLSRKVALKLVLPDRINEKTLALFAREARAGGRLAHPNIVAVHGYGEDDGRRWIAQELVEGAWTLRDFIDEMRKEDKLPENYYRAVAVFVAEMADALQAAHSAGVIHRDVKPQNVLVTSEDHPKLTDFGLALITDEVAVSMTGDFAGTWLYMSPEQVTAKRIELDHRTDIFSLGVVMYEMLVLVRPFDGDTTHQIAENIVMREPPDLRKIRSRVPRDLAVICGKALEKLKDARYQTMAEFAADLRRHLANEPIHAQPPTPLDRVNKWIRRNPTKSLAGSAAALAFLAISALTLHVADQETELEQRGTELLQSKHDLDSTGAVLTKQKTKALAAATAARTNAEDAQVRAAEAQFVADDALRLSLEQNYEDLVAEADALWPAFPDRITGLEEWLVTAEALLAELPNLTRKRDELETLAIPRTEEEIRTARESHPDFSQIAPLQAEITSKCAALAVRSGEVELALPELDWAQYPTNANALNSLAWPMLDPAREAFGDEALGLVLARRAAELAPATERAGILDSVAWGAFAVGSDEDAVAASHEALEQAPEGKHDEFAGYLAKLEAAVAEASSGEGLEAVRTHLTERESDLAQLEARVGERQHWTFPADAEERTRPGWWHHTISELIWKLESLSAEGTGLVATGGVSREHGWSVPRRMDSAKRLAQGFAPGGEFFVRWDATASAIKSAYPGLDLPVQMGLVPIGADPASTLWEFWHVESGTEPLRSEGGVLELEESSGLVFVLLPGGKFWMGASADENAPHNYDPGAHSNESPVHEVELSAFFLSKYEMTQGQWLRLSGGNPSSYGPESNFLNYEHDLTHPVEQVSWFECTELLEQRDLRLPSEAQWEYGARGGKETVWWTGSARESLRSRTAANLADQSARDAGARWSAIEAWPELEDGFVVHAPVDEFAANPFGLHNVHGNVWEWCLDVYASEFYDQSPDVDPANTSDASAYRGGRGGSFNGAASIARSAFRFNVSPRAVDSSLGLRPARGITSSSFATSPSSND